MFFEPERLPHEVRLRQLHGSRLQHRVSYDIDGGVEASVHELNAFIASRHSLYCVEYSIRKTNEPLFVVINETAFRSSMIPLTGFATVRSRLFCFQR